MFEEELSCKQTATHDEEWVEYFFGTNFYGDMTAIPATTLETFKYRWFINDTELAVVFRPVTSFGGQLSYVFNEVCNYPTMVQVMKRKVVQMEAVINSNLNVEPPPARNFPRLKTQALKHFYTKLANDEYWKNTYTFNWAGLFLDLTQAATLQTEAYLTYAGIFDVVIRGQLQLVPTKALSDGQEQCLSEISTMEQFVFILRHLLVDIPANRGIDLANNGNGNDVISIKALRRFLTQSSKYWARMHHEKVPAQCHKMIDLGPKIIEKGRNLTDTSPLYIQYRTYFERCIEMDPVVNEERSEVMLNMKRVFHTYFEGVLG